MFYLRAKQFPTEEAGFQNMIAQMKNKDDAIKAYQAQFQVKRMNECKIERDFHMLLICWEEDLILEPDVFICFFRTFGYPWSNDNFFLKVQQGGDDLVLEPDINMFSPDEDLIELGRSFHSWILLVGIKHF